jgi:uncharacterized protein
MIVPHDQLEPETLQTLIEDFVTRHGAVHGHTETSLAQQVESVRRQLASKKVVIVYDDEDESCSIVPTEHAKLL